MNDKDMKIQRRAFIKGMAVLPAAAALAFHGQAFAEMLTPEDPMAKTLGYTPKSDKKDQSCSSCSLYQGGDKPKGNCPIFAGKQVVSTGWCKSWTAKS